MTISRTFIIISTLLLFLNCQKKKSALEFEKSVLYEIIPAVIDSLNVDLISIAPPPPGRPIFDENDSLVGIDTIGSAKAMADYYKERKELIASKPRLTMFVMDSVHTLVEQDKLEFLKYFLNENLKIDTVDISSKYGIELAKIKTSRNMEFRFRSEFPLGYDLRDPNNNFKTAGTTSFSRIQFDLTKTFGVLNGDYVCGRLCGWGARIFIKKVDGKWTIQKVEEIWVS